MLRPRGFDRYHPVFAVRLRRALGMMSVLVTGTIFVSGGFAVVTAAEHGGPVFPSATWQTQSPSALGLDDAKLDAVAAALGSRGCIVKNGYLVKAWGAQDKKSDWFSSAKPVLSTLLMFAVKEGKATGFDQHVADFGWPLSPKDRTMTLRHLANMTSGYARPEEPSNAWAYNDYAIQLYQQTLFDKIFQGDPEQVFHDPQRFGALHLEDRFSFREKNRRMSASVRDFARVAWFWLNRGHWSGKQILPRAYFDENMRPQVPKDLPLSSELPTNDYLRIGSYGGESNHFTKAGPGVYGFNWWFNETGGRHPQALTWPDAPRDTVMSIGLRGNCAALMPSLNLVVVAADADWGPLEPGRCESVLNQRLKRIAEAGAAGDPQPTVWHPASLTFQGPEASESDHAPNPFLDMRLDVVFTTPSGQVHSIPGFFDGDGKSGPRGRVWRVRFAPDSPGTWRYQATFRQGPGVAISLDKDAGEPIFSEKLAGTVAVAPRDAESPGFLKWGRLEYVGQHYLKFRDGPYWLRGGTDSPENLLGYAGFVRTPNKHRFADHAADWRSGDPDWDNGQGRAIVGAINYLANNHVNSIYLLTMNVGGDGRDVWPWSGPVNPQGSPDNDNLHYDTHKLRQWETVFQHAQRQGIFLHFVLGEAEAANKRELDDGELGPERKLFYREMVARFGHHLALEWNLCEEYNLNFNFGPERLRAFADYLQAIDPYGHPITVHSAGDPVDKLRFTYGDPRFSLTSIQLNQRPIQDVTEAMRAETRRAGRPLPISLDEFTVDRGQQASHLPVDDAEGHRKEKIWPTYFSGGMLEFILEDLLKTDSFKTPEREKLWRYLWYARRFIEEHLPFWEMEPQDDLSRGGATIAVGIGRGRSVELGPQVLAKRGEVYAVYLPSAASTGTLDLSAISGSARQRWFNPRTGEFAAHDSQLSAGGTRALGPPPNDPNDDWVVLIERID